MVRSHRLQTPPGQRPRHHPTPPRRTPTRHAHRPPTSPAIGSPDLAVMELPAPSRAGGGAHERGWLWWQIYRHLVPPRNPRRPDVPNHRMPSTPPARAQATKNLIVDSVARRFPDWPTAGDDNAADAVVLMAAGRDWLGAPSPTCPRRTGPPSTRRPGRPFPEPPNDHRHRPHPPRHDIRLAHRQQLAIPRRLPQRRPGAVFPARIDRCGAGPGGRRRPCAPAARPANCASGGRWIQGRTSGCGVACRSGSGRISWVFPRPRIGRSTGWDGTAWQVIVQIPA
jgi:hypothetical protein